MQTLNFSTLNLFLFLRISFIFEHDLDLEIVKVNLTTHQIVFIFINYGMVHSILIRFLTAYIGITGDYILTLV